MIKTVNGGKTQLNLFNSAWWGNKLPENEMFEVCESSLLLIGGNVFSFPDEEELQIMLRVSKGDSEYRTGILKGTVEISGKEALGRSWGRLIENISVT